MTIHELGLSGRHNTYHCLAAGIVSNVYGLRKESVRESFADPNSTEHRLESVAKVRNIEFINDSKATNVNSAWFALESMSKPVIWIAGGIDKGNYYHDVEAVVKKKVRAIICIGANNVKIHAAFRAMGVIVNVTNMSDAVRMAYQLANAGDCVLLSPACASFDLFENYEDRGRKFKEAVCQL